MGPMIVPEFRAPPAHAPRVSCRRCGAPVDPGAQAALAATNPRLLLDCACGACGHRALYPFS